MMKLSTIFVAHTTQQKVGHNRKIAFYTVRTL